MSSVELNYTNSDLRLVKITGSVGGIVYRDVTTKEIVIGESLLNPGLMTSVTFQSATYSDFKNYMDLKNKDLNLNLSNRLGDKLSLNLKVYRLDNRSMMPLNVGRSDEFTIHACHNTLLEDAQHVMSKSWKCTTPSDVVSEALNCVGASSSNVSPSGPARDYIAEMIHPFQVIQQQCNAALDGDDPSFVHYMTYEGANGTHHFRSLKSMINEGEVDVFTFSAANIGSITQTDYNNRQYDNNVIVFEFPCMFDYLTDLLNGVNEFGQNMNAGTFINHMSMIAQFVGGAGAAQSLMSGGCFNVSNMKQSMTNKGSSQQDYGCSSDVESHLLLRQARMALLDRDKIALRMTVPWAPHIHVGNKIRFNWFDEQGALMPESNAYIVSSLTHKIQLGGFSTSSFDCIKTTF